MMFIGLFLTGKTQTLRDWPEHPDMLVVINPAFSGLTSALSISAYHSRRFSSLQSSPSASSIVLLLPSARQKTTLGLHILSDRLGPLTKNGVELSYAYRTSITTSDFLSLGMSLKLGQLKFDANHLILNDPNDRLLADLDAGGIMPPGLNVGLHYKTGTIEYDKPVQFNAGVAFGRFLPLKDRFNSFDLDRTSEWFSNIGMEIFISEQTSLKTDFLCKKITFNPTGYAVRMNLMYHHLGWLMTQYTRSGQLSGQIGFNLGSKNEELEKIKIFIGSTWSVQRVQTSLGRGFCFGFSYFPRGRS